MWDYRARCLNVIDGDTIDVKVDVGFRMRRTIRLRLLGVDTHETYGTDEESEEYQRGKREAEFVRDWMPGVDGETTGSEASESWPIIVRTEKKGAFGRYLAEVERVSDGAVLNDVLLATFEGVESDY